jgi:hypothetical protein
MSSDEEKDFAIVPAKPNSMIYSSLEEIELNGSNLYAFFRFPKVWKEFVEWRGKEESNMNSYLLRENQKFDNLVAEAFRTKIITQDRDLFDFLLTKYSDSGARKTMNRIRVVLNAFRTYYVDKHSGEKTP